jgi:hypothetical protein
MGGVSSIRNLPTGFFDAGNHAVESEIPETNATQLELANHGAGSAAQLAAVLDPRRKLRLLAGFDYVCGGRHIGLTF